MLGMESTHTTKPQAPPPHCCQVLPPHCRRWAGNLNMSPDERSPSAGARCGSQSSSSTGGQATPQVLNQSKASSGYLPAVQENEAGPPAGGRGKPAKTPGQAHVRERTRCSSSVKRRRKRTLLDLLGQVSEVEFYAVFQRVNNPLWIPLFLWNTR